MSFTVNFVIETRLQISSQQKFFSRISQCVASFSPSFQAFFKVRQRLDLSSSDNYQFLKFFEGRTVFTATVTANQFMKSKKFGTNALSRLLKASPQIHFYFLYYGQTTAAPPTYQTPQTWEDSGLKHKNALSFKSASASRLLFLP